MRLLTFLLFGFVFLNHFAYSDKSCKPRKYNHSSVVCVCNENYCDEVSKLKPLPKGRFVAYLTSQKGLRFAKLTGNMTNEITRPTMMESFREVYKHFVSRRGPDAEIRINRDKTYQTIMGFGGAFSDSAAINYFKLSKNVRNKFIRSYFSDNGIEYNMGRVPIAGSDFSTHPYAYNSQPEDDINLSNFSLSIEDFKYKIPMIKDAKKVASEEIHLMASAWSPPVWMKDNRDIGGVSRLLLQYYQTWADYHLKFLKEYDKKNISFWSITTGNEPSNGNTNVMLFNSLGWILNEQANWIANHLGPTLRSSKYSKIKIVAIDDHRYYFPYTIALLAQNEKAYNYVDGFGIHWYWDQFFSANLVEVTHNWYPDKFLINTESCIGIFPWIVEKVQLGSWSGAELYAKFMIDNFNRWYTGWIDWNLNLDREGGPNWYNNHVDSPTIVLTDKNEFLKQPSFYAIGHFSKFVPRGSIKIASRTVRGNLYHIAFLRPDKGVAVIIFNQFDSSKMLTIREKRKGVIRIDIPERSIITVVYY